MEPRKSKMSNKWIVGHFVTCILQVKAEGKGQLSNYFVEDLRAVQLFRTIN